MGAGMRAIPNDERNYAAIQSYLPISSCSWPLVCRRRANSKFTSCTTRLFTGSIMRRLLLLIHHRHQRSSRGGRKIFSTRRAEYEMSTVMMNSQPEPLPAAEAEASPKDWRSIWKMVVFRLKRRDTVGILGNWYVFYGKQKAENMNEDR